MAPVDRGRSLVRDGTGQPVPPYIGAASGGDDVMPTVSHADTARSLARMMILQSRMLRAEGFVAEARELARRALTLGRLGTLERFVEG